MAPSFVPSLVETDLFPLRCGFNLKYDDNCCSDETQWDYRILRDACADASREFRGTKLKVNFENEISNKLCNFISLKGEKIRV